MAELIIIAGGQHARVVGEAARSREPDLAVAFVDPAPMTVTHRLERQIMSDADALTRADAAHYVLGLGGIKAGRLRRSLVRQYEMGRVRWFTIIHATAWVSPSARLAPGAVILAGAVVNTGASIGAHCIVNTGAIVEHDVTLGDFSVVAPGVVIGGGVQVGEDCYLGLGCRVRDHVSIGAGTVVGMGAVVVDSLPAGVEAVGVPARARAKGSHANRS